MSQYIGDICKGWYGVGSSDPHPRWTIKVQDADVFPNRGAKQAQQILEQAAAMFAGGSLTDEDKIAFMDEIQSLYLDSKRRAKKFTPKKYLKNQEEK